MTGALKAIKSRFLRTSFLYKDTNLKDKIYASFAVDCMKVKSVQRPVTEGIRTQSQPSKPKREITNITKSKNTKRTYGQPSEQSCHSATQTELNNMNTHIRGNVNETLTPKQATETHNRTTALELLLMNYREAKTCFTPPTSSSVTT